MLQTIMANYSQKPVPERAHQDNRTFTLLILTKFKCKKEALSNSKILSPVSGISIDRYIDIDNDKWIYTHTYMQISLQNSGFKQKKTKQPVNKINK